MSDGSVAAASVRRIALALAQQGLDVAQLCLQLGLDPRLFEQDSERIALEPLRRLWDLAVVVSGQDALGVLAAGQREPGGLDVIDYVMMSSATLGAALEQAVRYARIVGDATEIRLLRHPQGQRVVFDFMFTGLPVPCASIEFSLASNLNFYRWITRTSIRPILVEFCHPAPPDLRPYQRVLDCPIRFAAVRNSIALSHHDLALPLFSHNAALAELHQRYADQRIVELSSTAIGDRVRRMLVLALPGGEPTRQQIAAALCLSGSTLHRRLLAEGCSFQALLDETRRTLAACYLSNARISLSEVTRLLGFNEQSSLSRACQRWFQQSPQEYRYQLVQLVAPARQHALPASAPALQR